MDKLDILMFILGITAYFAILIDLKSNQRRFLQYEMTQEKKRLYFEKIREAKYKDELRDKARRRNIENSDSENSDSDSGDDID